ncbi:MAG: endonuclease [Cloacibacterium sp.]|nr:endonuclease [Cloacibacterium sp.]
MKTKNYLFMVLCLISTSLFSQIPTGYYDSAAGLSGAALKTKLSTIITNGHVDKGYAGLWTAYKTTDIDKNYENDGSILDMYSENPSGTDPYKFIVTTDQCGTYSVEGDCYNREHVVPQSLFNQAAPMVSDLHHIRATDGKVNGMRSNYPFGKVGTATFTSRNGGKLGNSVSSGYTGTVFEPIDEFKGDIARMIFYFVTRYESKLSGFSTGNMLGTSTYPGLQTWERDVLLAWHNLDPVSQAEINRNNASYTFQGNRNPFIDKPEYVALIWGGTSTDTTAPTVPTNLTSSSITTTSATVSWTASTDNVGVTGYKVFRNGTQVGTSTSTSYNLTGLTAGTTYSITAQAYDAAGNSSTSSTALSLTTTNNTADTTAPSVPSGLTSSSITQTSATVSWAASTDNVGVTGYKIFRNGTQVGTSTSTSYGLTGLTAGTTYSITVQAYDAAGNSSASSTTLSLTTTAAATFTELYFSEYLEGSSNNKAIEISNRTGSSIALSAYSIKKQVNGSTSWTAVATLSGTLANNTTYVVAHSSYALTCGGTINLKTTNLDFNGNDTVGLFKNNVLIDIIGTSGSSANFALDVTLRRNVSKPRTTYLASEWTSYTMNTCTNIGTVNPTGTARMMPNQNLNSEISIYPNPVQNKEVFFKGNIQGVENVKVYDMNGKLVFEAVKPFAKTNKLNLKNLPKGNYIITYDNQSQKLIIE